MKNESTKPLVLGSRLQGSTEPKYEHNQQYEQLLDCIRELEAGVLETAKSNDRYASEVSKIEPELEAVTKKNIEIQLQLDAAVENTRRLQHESARHSSARGDILAQLQDALVREADLRDRVEKAEQDCARHSRELLDASINLNEAENAARQMHLAVCKPDACVIW